MKGVILAVLSAGHIFGCTALTVDYYDPARQITRRVSYEAGERSLRLSPPKPVEIPGRRLGALDDVTPITVRLSANPDDFYLKQNDTAVIIFGTSIELAAEHLLWSPGLDLIVKATHVNLPRSIKLDPRADGSGRSVQISAWKLTVPAEGCTIDVSGQSGGEKMWKADNGREEGEDGARGADGMTGGQGGGVIIQAGSIVGGQLTIEANGGRGGNGQDGGDGRRGVTGAQLEDQRSCCKRKKEDRHTTGTAGSPGGNAGAGGNGGVGGMAGYVRVLTKAGDALPNVVTHNDVGEGGVQGEAGQPGPGGHGGPGSGIVCVRMDRFGFDRRCTGPLGATGQTGAVGAVAVGGNVGIAGSENPTQSESLATTLAKVRQGSCGQHLRFEQYLADKLYREAHQEADYIEAEALYEWIAAVRDLTPESCIAEEQGPWYQTTLDANLKLQQMSLLQDFWGFRRDSAPLLSFDSLLSTTQRLLDLAVKAEGAYDLYLSDATENAERKSLVMQAIQNLDYDVEEAKKEMEVIAEQIQQIRPEIVELDNELSTKEDKMIEDGASCDLAIKRKAAGDHYNRGTGLQEILWYTRATTRVADGTWKSMQGVWGSSVAIWASTSLVLVPAVMALPGVVGSSLSLAGLFAIESAVMGTINIVNTIISDTKAIKATSDNILADVKDEMETLKGKWGENKKALDSRSQNMMLNGDFDRLVEAWIGELPECRITATTYQPYKTVADQLNAKIAQHDMYVMQFAATQMRRSKAMQDRKDLWANSHTEFNPTGMKFMTSIAESYRSQKNHIITMMKQLREAMNYEDCSAEAFKYQDARVIQLQVFVADVVAERNRKHSTDLSRRAVIAHNPQSVTTEYGPADSSLIVVTLEDNNVDASLALAFSNFRSDGILRYTLGRDHPSLPKGVANLRVVSAQAYVPALMGSGSTAQVWMKIAGASTCTDANGFERTFSHASQGYISMFSTEGDAYTTPTFFSKTKMAQSTVGPSPLGQWDISVPQVDQAGRAAVSKVELHLVLSYVPCAVATCSAMGVDSLAAVAHAETLQTTVSAPAGALLAVAGIAFTVVAAVVGVSVTRRRRS